MANNRRNGRNNKNNDKRNNRNNRGYDKRDKQVKEEKAKDVKSQQGVESTNFPVDPMNDREWYNRTPQLTKDAASLSFGNPLGNKITFSSWAQDLTNPFVPQAIGNIGDPNDGLTQSIPGIMRLNYALTAGLSTDNYSPINMAATDIYSWVRHANSGAKNYDAPDLMLYLYCVDSAYSFYSWCTRVYGSMMLAVQLNKYVGRALITSMGLNFNDLLANLANFRYYINSFAVRLGQLYVPNTMPVFKRHLWMNANVYTDGAGAKAQMYYYNPDGFYVYDELNGAGRAKFVTFSPTTYQDIANFGEDMLGRILASEDMGIMSGDIKHAYGSNLFNPVLIGDNYVVAPVFAVEVLLQMHNARFLGTINHNDITQNVDPSDPQSSGALICTPYMTGLPNPVDSSGNKIPTLPVGPYLIDFPSTLDTDPGSVMVASRLTAAVTASKVADADIAPQYPIVTCGNEIPTTFDVYTFKYTASNGPDPIYTWGVHRSSRNTSYFTLLGSPDVSTVNGCANWLGTLVGLTDITKFDWFPLTYISAYAGDIDGVKYGKNIGLLNDLANYTTLTDETLKKMHEVALLSSYGVPQNG